MKRTLRLGNKICTFYKDLTQEESENVLAQVKKWSKNADFCAKTEKNLQTDNCGTTILTSKRAVVILSNQTSKAEMLNTFAHEVRHVVDAIIAETPGISPAQLTGDIFSHFADWL